VQEIAQRIQGGLQKYVVENGIWPAGVPHLSRDPGKFALIKSSDPPTAWRKLIKKLKDFRQGYRYPDSNGRPYGRSKWPEPDAIRRHTGVSAAKHKHPRSTLDKYPRAQFGLPIIFQFKDDDDPGDTTLQGVNHDRLASPLILRPIACSDGAVGLAAILEGPRTPPGGLILKGASDPPPKVDSQIDPADVPNIPPLASVNEADVLQAFLKFLK